MDPSEENRVYSEAGEGTLAELAERFARDRVVPLRSFAGPIAFSCDTAVEGVAAAAGLARTRLDGLILPFDRLVGELPEVLRREGFAVQRRGSETPVAAAAPAEPVPGRVSLLTSGTTGAPKLVHHRWETLRTYRRSTPPEPNRWLLTYQTGTYAWFQMMTLALFAPAQELVVSERLEPEPLIGLAARHRATAISSTPTFWRHALLRVDPAEVRSIGLRQITLGGEPVDQAILDQLKRQFPSARVSHIYASTEVGAAIVVSDGREGFPAAWLEESGGGDAERRVQLRVEGGTLQVRSPHASLDHQGWVDTGDAVERRDDRVLVIGRRESSFINVGGMKITTHAVERALLEHPRVAWCRVRARQSNLMGSLIAADLVLRTPAENALEMEAELAGHARARLPDYAVPRLWRLLDAIPTTGNLKTELS